MDNEIHFNEYSNIKNVILDLDNTIIRNYESDSEYFKEILINNGYDENDFYMLFESLDKYDKSITEENNYYNREEMLNFINKYLGRNYSIEIVNGIIQAIGTHWAKRVMLKEDIIKRLSQKYNLYIYTNFFKEAQEKRVKTIGFHKYIKKVFASDTVGAKPFKKSFENLLNEINSTPDECIMIGDKIETDILAASNIGMKSILIGESNINENLELHSYITLEDVNDIENILL